SADVLVQAEVSCARWVIMPLQKGPTLAEWIKEKLENDNSPPARIALAERVTIALAYKLDELASARSRQRRGFDGASIGIRDVTSDGQHLDLSPSNVIVVSDAKAEGLRLRFIDLGPNHLYTRQAGVDDHDDAMYVAPEVKNRNRSSTSD